MYKIGHLNNRKQREIALLLQDKLKSTSDSDSQLFSYDHNETSDPADIALKSLLDKSSDVFCLDLPLIGKNLPTEILIAGLSERSQQFDKLVYNEDPDSPAPHIKLGVNARIVCYDARSYAIANNLFPEWQISLKKEKLASIKKELSEFDGLILGTSRINDLAEMEDISGFSIFQFHPKEFIPGAGQNVSAYLIRSEDKELRKLINGIHISEVSQATNIERAIEQDLINRGWDAVGVYCILDSNSHYHVHICGRENEDSALKKCRYSSGTSENIVNNVFELLSKND